MERIIIDMDEVIADPMGDMIEWYRKTNQLEFDNSKISGGSWIKGFPEHHQQFVYERLLSVGFFRNLPVIKDSIEVLEEMNKYYEIFIVSAAMEFPNSLKEKLEWMLEHFPFFTWKQIALCGDKSLVCGDYMIDDHVKNLRTFKGKPYLFTSAHNLDVTGYERLNNWKEVGEKFLK